MTNKDSGSQGIVGAKLEELEDIPEEYDEEKYEKINLVEAVQSTLHKKMEEDDRVIVMGEDVGKNGGVFRATDGLYETFGEERVLDTPLAESGIVGTAIGMARNGKRPVAELQFMGFMPPAFDQLISHAARLRWRSSNDINIPLVVRMPMGAGLRSPEHHSESMEAYIAHTPGVKVVMPSTAVDTRGLLVSAINDPDPVVFLEPKKIYRRQKELVPRELYEIPIGEANKLQEGEDLTILTWGAMTIPCREIADELQEDGIGVDLLDLRTVMPYDRDAIIESFKKTGRCIVVHEAPRSFGPGAEMIAKIQEEALLHMEAPIRRVTSFDTPPPLGEYEDYYLPGKDRIREAADYVLNF